MSEKPLFVTLNPPRPPRGGTLLHSELYEHPIFDAKAIAAQRQSVVAAGASGTRGFAARISARDFTRTGCRPGLLWPSSSAAFAGRGTWPNESGRIVLTARAADARRRRC